MSDTLLIALLAVGALALYSSSSSSPPAYSLAAPGAPLPAAPYVPTSQSAGGRGPTSPSVGQYVAACLGTGVAGAEIGSVISPGWGTAIGGVSGCAIGAYVASQTEGR